jgi:outer membrane protein assembly factor BamB
MLRITFLILVVSSIVPMAAKAQLCANTSPLSQVSFSPGASVPGIDTTSLSDVIAFQGNVVYMRDRTDLTLPIGSKVLTDGVIAIRAVPSPGGVVTNQTNGWVSFVDLEENLVWRRNLSRGGCGADSVSRFPSVFDDTRQLVYVGTSFDSSPGCNSGHSTDNRIHALSVLDGSIAYTFNGSGMVDVDQVAGFALDSNANRLYATTERTSLSQHSLWSLDTSSLTTDWSVDAGRIRIPPLLHGGRLYIANVSGQIKAFDPATGSEHWSVSVAPVPFIEPSKLHVVDVVGVGTLITVADLAGRIHVVRDDGSTSTVLHSVQLPDGVTTPGIPAVRASGPMIAVDSGGALAGADDGQVYPFDLVAGTVGTPLSVGSMTTTITDLLLEPAGVFASPGSFLVSNDDGTLARYCTTLGAPASVPALGPLGLGGLAFSLAAIGGRLTRRKSRA